MAMKIKTALPDDLDLAGSYIIEWDAVDPTSGATVAGVLISNTSLLVGGTFGEGEPGPAPSGTYQLVPGPGA